MGHLQQADRDSMPLYQSHKQVRALKIQQVLKHAHPDPQHNDQEFELGPDFTGAHLFFEKRGMSPLSVTAEWYRRHNPSAGGYYVLYEDGYASYSPAKAFEEGYTLVS